MATKLSLMFPNRATPGENDMVIAVMGMTGSGKSSLISLCTDREIEIGHELKSCTQEIETYVLQHPKLRSGRVYLVDTPGFDDTNRNDTEILRTLGAWLTATYSTGVKLSGIIYCHRINQTRMQGSAIKNIQLFRSLCGDDALSKVVLVTTMWDIEALDKAEKREKELKENIKYWGGMVAKGSQVLRHDNTRKSAFAIIESFIAANSKFVLNIQEEIVNDQKPPDNTDAEKDVQSLLEKHDTSLRSVIKSVKSELRDTLRKKDEELAEAMRELRLEHKQALKEVLNNQQKLQATMQQLHESKFTELEAKLEAERRKAYNIPGPSSSTISEHQPDGAYQLSKVPSLNPPGEIRMEYLFSRQYPQALSGAVDGLFEISADGSCIAISARPKNWLIEISSGKQIDDYNIGSLGNRLASHFAFASDGGILTASDGSTMYKATRGGVIQKWYTRKDESFMFQDNDISADLESTVDIVDQRVVLIWPTTRKSRQLELNSQLPELCNCHFLFAKHDKLLALRTDQHLHFFSTATGRMLKTEPLPTSHHSWALSGDTLFLAIRKDRSVLCYQLSGPLPILVSTVRLFGSSTFSLSFDGSCLLIYVDISAIFIFHTMSGKQLLVESLDYSLGFFWCRFFPSDDRILLLKSCGYQVAQLIT